MLAMLFYCIPPSREGIFIDLLLDLRRRISDENCAGGIARAHLPAFSLPFHLAE